MRQVIMLRILVVGMMVILIVGCASFPKPEQIVPPEPVKGNSGKFMCPYTQDETISEWVDTGMNARAASSIGGAVGGEVGKSLVKKIPIVGNIFGGKLGEEGGRKIAIKSAGGWKKIKETSDTSFESCNDLAVWLYVTKSHRDDYKKVFKLTCGIYPKLCKKYKKYIIKEYKKQRKNLKK